MSALGTAKAFLRPARLLFDDVAKRGALSWRWRRRNLVERTSHGLAAPLILTLTSFPARFPTLHLTLRSLLAQSVRADRVVLWIAEADFSSLPKRVLDLQADGLEVRRCEDLKSYKKIVPALLAFPDAYLVTADDDIYYWSTWLEELVRALSVGAELPCHRAHRIVRQSDQRPAPYVDWQQNIGPEAGPDIFPTTGHGVLYPPDSFDRRVTNVDMFNAMCPTGDDIWLFAMAELEGKQFRKVGARRRFHEWLGTQRQSLYSSNGSGGGNDRQIAGMRAHFGLP